MRAELHDRAVFEQAVTHDAYALTPGSDLLTRLRGKDVLLVFVESYGRVAVEDSWFAPQVDHTLAGATAHLDRLGFHARSGWLGSPTFGGISWLAHSTLQSGLWIDSQQRYDQVLCTDRLTLASAFGRAGWRTVDDVPSDWHAWPEGQRFYHYDRMYGSYDVGYAGPRLGYARVPDQFTLHAFDDLELRAHRRPVMAEIDLDSSHTPWTSVPRLLPWDALGDGTVYDSVRGAGVPYDTSLLSTLATPGPSRPATPHHPLLAPVAGLVRAPRPRQEPGDGRPRRPPAQRGGQRPRRLPRRAGLADRPRPRRAASHLVLGLDPRPAAGDHHPDGPDERVPRPVPVRLRLAPHDSVTGSNRSVRSLVSPPRARTGPGSERAP